MDPQYLFTFAQDPSLILIRWCETSATAPISVTNGMSIKKGKLLFISKRDFISLSRIRQQIKKCQLKYTYANRNSL